MSGALTAAQQAFGIDAILGRIFDAGNIMDNLHLRLVNKKFNAECLRAVRVQSRKVSLRIRADPYSGANFSANGFRWLREQKIGDYCNFVLEIAKIRVEELHVMILKGVTEANWQLLHDKLHELLEKCSWKVTAVTGLMELCAHEGCPQCIQYADRCTEYGPLQLGGLDLMRKRTEKHHYKQLWIANWLLRAISTDCYKQCQQRPITRLDEYINARSISCDTLLIRWNELESITSVIPQEVLETMIRVWSVKEVVISVVANGRDDSPPSGWICLPTFTPFYIFGGTRRHRQSQCFVARLHVDLLQAEFADGDAFIAKPLFRHQVFNFHRLVPTNRVTVALATTDRRQDDVANRLASLAAKLRERHPTTQEVLPRGLTVDFVFVPNLRPWEEIHKRALLVELDSPNFEWCDGLEDTVRPATFHGLPDDHYDELTLKGYERQYRLNCNISVFIEKDANCEII